MASNPRNANGAARRRLCRRVKAEEDTCGICGEDVDKTLQWPDPWSGTVDEIVPVSLGGDPLDRANCRLAHFRCNVQRGDGTKPRPEAVKRARTY